MYHKMKPIFFEIKFVVSVTDSDFINQSEITIFFKRGIFFLIS
jgi:hypothetical protein